MNAKEQAIFDALPKPTDVEFTLVKVEPVYIPHPYCVTSKHVVHAADHFSGRLGMEALEDAEKHGASCGTCHRPYSEHTAELTAWIAVPQNRDLNAVAGLHAYLRSIKEQAAALGIEGFAFPLKKVSSVS